MRTFREWMEENSNWFASSPDTLHIFGEKNPQAKGVTFQYDPETDALDTDDLRVTHYAAFDTHRESSKYLVLGRTIDAKGGCCAFWRTDNSANYAKAVQKLLKDHHIDGNYEITIDGKNKGKASKFVTASPIAQIDVEVDIPNYGKEKLHNIPRLMHTLPENPQKQAIKAFICSNYKKYDLLANLVDRAGCERGRYFDSLKPHLRQTLAPDNINSLRKRDIDRLFSYYVQQRDQSNNK